MTRGECLGDDVKGIRSRPLMPEGHKAVFLDSNRSCLLKRKLAHGKLAHERWTSEVVHGGLAMLREASFDGGLPNLQHSRGLRRRWMNPFGERANNPRF